MPFLGVLPHRKHIFQPVPDVDVAVNDTEAWRLNPGHRHVYNKLDLSLWQGMKAAPCGVNPMGLGLTPDTPLFVKPVINLKGMALDTCLTSAEALADSMVECVPGRFWCEYLSGMQSSTDCLVLNGEVLWYAHTRAAAEKNHNRPLYWHIGAEIPEIEDLIATYVADQLATYTGLCNLEVIDGRIIEVHLRGSNAFFDFYGEDFIAAWVQLVDHQIWSGLNKIPGGYLYSVFTEVALVTNWESIGREHDVVIVPDHLVADRVAIIYAGSLGKAEAAANSLVTESE